MVSEMNRAMMWLVANVRVSNSSRPRDPSYKIGGGSRGEE